MQHFTDQLGRNVTVKEFPQRIISLVPSQTELLYDIGLDKEIAGITKFCIHPGKWFSEKLKIGGTKQINIEKIKSLRPDLILANKEENVKEQIQALEKIFPTWTSDIKTLDNALEMIKSVGMLCGRSNESENISTTILREFEKLVNVNKPLLKCCYLIWRNPYMTVGRDTFIHNMLSFAGFENIFQDKNRYPVIDIEEIVARNPDFIFLSSEPYPFKQKHADELFRLSTRSKILFVDGELFSWYGSRLLKSPSYFKQLQIEAFQYFR